jgi:hypothetical protein
MPVIKISKCLNCGVKHEWVFDAPKLKELRVIKSLTGMNGVQFLEASDEGDAEAMAALLYILHKRDKITIPFEDVDLDFATFSIEPTEEEKAAAELANAEAAQAEANGEKKDPFPNGPTNAEDSEHK